MMEMNIPLDLPATGAYPGSRIVMQSPISAELMQHSWLFLCWHENRTPLQPIV